MFVKTLMDTVAMDHIPGHGTSAGSSSGGDRPTPIEYYKMWQQSGGDATKMAELIQQWYANQQGGANADAISKIYAALPPNVSQNGQQISQYEWYDASTGLVYYYEPKAGVPSWRKGTIAESKATLAQFTDGAGGGSSSDGGSGGGSALGYAQLQAQYMNMGLDPESARRQALTT